MQSALTSRGLRSRQSLVSRPAIRPRLGWLSILVLPAWLALAQPAGAEPKTVAPSSDPTLAALIQQSLTARPELARAEASVRANQQRLPQARALPDPMLQVGIQNDGFKGIEIGRMETSYVSLMASQTFPWPGKLGLRGTIAELTVEEAKNGVIRQRLSTEAEVRRAYVSLILARDRLGLLGQLESIWENSLAMTKILYQNGGGSQSDMLRAQLELQRLKQRRLALQAEENSQIQALNRLRNHPLTEPIATSAHLKELPLRSAGSQFSPDRAVAQSPELASARLGIARAGKSAALAERGYYPDLTVGAGIMFRGALPPMWTVTVAGPVPLFGGSKQKRAVEESREWGNAAQSEVASIEQVIRLRSKERETAFSALLMSLQIYDEGLLIESQATLESTLIQYKVGKVSFASVLEASSGYLADQEGYLESIAAAQRLLIAESEIALSPTEMPTSSGGSGGMPGAGQVSSSGSAANTSGASSAAPGNPAGSSSSM